MILSIHVPMFGTEHTEARALVCKCGTNDWEWNAGVIGPLAMGQKLKCLACGNISVATWGLDEPDHISTWLNGEYCPHRLCALRYEKLRNKKGWL